MAQHKVEVIDLQKGFEMKKIKPVSYEFIGVSPTDLSDVTHLTRQQFNERVTELKEKIRVKPSKEETKMDNFTYPMPPSSRDFAELSSEFQDVTMNQDLIDSEPFSDAFPNKRVKVEASSEFSAITSDQSIINM